MFDLMTTECFQGWTGINFWQTEYNSCIEEKKNLAARTCIENTFELMIMATFAYFCTHFFLSLKLCG